MILSNLLRNSVEKSPSEKPIGPELVQKLPELYGIRMFIATFKGEHHLSIFWVRSIHFRPKVTDLT